MIRISNLRLAQAPLCELSGVPCMVGERVCGSIRMAQTLWHHFMFGVSDIDTGDNIVTMDTRNGTTPT